MRKWCDGILKVFFGAFFALTSLYCLLAFLPYTYYSLIKSPAYSWMPWFVRHHDLLFWIAVIAGAVAFRTSKRRWAFFVCFGVLAGMGIFLAVQPFLAGAETNRTTYLGGIAALWIVILVVAVRGLEFPCATGRNAVAAASLSYPIGIALAVGVAVLNAAGAQVRTYSDTRSWAFHAADVYLTVWSLISHVLVAVILVSIFNLIRVGAARTPRPIVARWLLFGLLIFGALWLLAVRFLENALSFEGWLAHLYAASLAGALTVLGFSIAQPFLVRDGEESRERSTARALLFIVPVVMAIFAVTLPALVGGGDWNGFYEGAFTLVFWGVVSFYVFRLVPRKGAYPVKTILAVLILSLFSYKALTATELFWAKPLGETDEDIERTLEKYADRDTSFNLAYRMLGSGPRREPCGELCRILREYTEIRSAQARFDLKLVDPLVPASGERPNIFLFVIDSMRPDYLGAYNPKATFTPNLDALARDSVVVRNVWTPYAGTSLSEPAIWAGALLLHAHFMQPFERLNSLEKLAKTDGYQMIVSEDEILREILSAVDERIKLDADKKLWNQLEVCSTLQQAESAIEHRSDTTRPILFYTQPKNVHQFARNDLPQAKAANWPAHPGFNYRVSFELHQVDECLGGFIGWLKAHGLYDNSIIMLTSDHGDATGEFGRNSHSLVIYPEVMRVPLIVHLPKAMQNKFVHDDDRVSALVDITPSLYYLLGHRPIAPNPLFGHPLLMESVEQLHAYHRDDLFMASDVRAAYGVLGDNGRYFYATYDSPAQSYLYDLTQDPNGEHDILTPELKKRYDDQVIEHLRAIADFYGYRPSVRSVIAAGH